MLKAALVFGVFLLVTEHSLATDWRYQEEEKWSSGCQNGQLQSPIALSKSIAKEKHFSSLIMSGYDRSASATMKNNGHSAEVRLHILQNKPEIRGGTLHHAYVLDHLHFHWQSEHTIEGRRFPLELHLVHHSKEFHNISEALKSRHGVAVFAVLFELSPDNDDELQPLVDIINHLKDRVGEPRELDGFVVKDFFPRDKAGYYRYEGSLTTPGCTEGIVWTVFTNTLPISEQQVKIFEQMEANDKTLLKQNYRSLQELNDRPVYIKISPIGSDGTVAQISGFLLGCISFLYVCNSF